MLKEKYEIVKEKLSEIIKLKATMEDSFYFILVNDDIFACDAPSGSLYPNELLELENGFMHVSKFYKGYDSLAKLWGEIQLGILKFNNKIPILYGTSQIGSNIDRRSYLPLICQIHSIVNVNSNAYTLGILQNKAHYYHLLENSFPVPKTIVFNENDESTYFQIPSEKVIIKPSLECGALGISVAPKSELTTDLLKNIQDDYQQKIIIQEFISGIEVSVPVLNISGKYISLPPVEVIFEGDYLNNDLVNDFKYNFKVIDVDNYDMHIDWISLMDCAESVATVFQPNGLFRVDFRINNLGEYYIIDLAALPVLSSTGTCFQSINYLFPNEEYPLFDILIASALSNLPSTQYYK